MKSQGANLNKNRSRWTVVAVHFNACNASDCLKFPKSNIADSIALSLKLCQAVVSSEWS